MRWVVFARGPLVLEGGRRGRAVAAAAEASPAVFEITLSLHEACRCLTPPKELRRRGGGEGTRKVLKRGRRIGLSVSRAIPERVSTIVAHVVAKKRIRLSESGLSFPSSNSCPLKLPKKLGRIANFQDFHDLLQPSPPLSLLSHSRSAIDDPRATIRIGD